MRTPIIAAIATLSCFVFPTVDDASAQSRALQQRLANATRIECSFSTIATSSWEDGAANLAVEPREFEAAFFDIDVEGGTAESDGRFGASYIVVRYTFLYLHLMHMLDSGPLYVTTILAAEASEGRLMAVHTRHEYSPTVIPGFTSRPEMYVGDCAVEN